MKILQVGTGDFFSTYGGGQVYVKNLIDAFINLNAEIVVLSFTIKPYWKGYSVKNYKGKNLIEAYDTSDKTIEDIIRKVNPDIIHAHSHKGQVCKIGRDLVIPVVVTAHHGGIVCPAGTLMNCKDRICREKADFKNCLPCVLRNIRSGKYWYPFMRLLPHKGYSRLGSFLKSKPFVPFITPIGSAAVGIDSKEAEWKDIVDNVTLMIAPSKELGSALVRNGLSEDKLKIVTHGIPVAGTDCGKANSWDKQTIDFFHVGRVCYIKGLHVLVKAFMKVSCAEARLHIIGEANSNAEKRYEARLKRMSGNDKRIVWHGKINPQEITKVISGYDVGLSSSVCMEAFGLNIAEALACKKPVLAVRNGGAEMQIVDGVNGWMVDANDVDALAEKMRDICDNRIDLELDRANFKVKTITEHAAEFLDFYASLL